MISISPITTEHRRLKNKMESQIEVDGIDEQRGDCPAEEINIAHGWHLKGPAVKNNEG